jgi:hypothetical protein
MSVNDINEEVRAVVRDSADLSTELLGFLTGKTDNPMLAMTTLMLSSAVMAKSIGLPREAFMEGTGAAFLSLEEGSPHVTH